MDNMIYITEENVRLLQNGKRNILFGAGDYALNSLKFLQAYGITVDGILMDEAYLSSQGGQKSLEGVEVFPIRTIPANSNFIFGISSIARWQQLQQEYPGLVAFAVYDPLGFIHRDPCSLQDVPMASIYDMLADASSKETLEDYVYKRTHRKAPEKERLCLEPIYFNALTRSAKHRKGAFVNAGAHYGESTDAYLRFVGDEYRTVYNFDPDVDSYRVLSEKYRGKEHIKSIQAGLLDRAGVVSFSQGRGEESVVDSMGDTQVQMETIDHFFASIPVSFIKLNIMGYAALALQGAGAVINRDAPIIASEAFVSWDALRLPLIVQSLLTDGNIRYQYYDRNHYAVNYGLIFYAIPEESSR